MTTVRNISLCAFCALAAALLWPALAVTIGACALAALVAECVSEKSK